MNNFKKIALGTITAGTMLAGTQAYAGEASANIAAASNYLFRGVTQTMNEAAVSGGLDYADDSGFYVGTWASNVNFGEGSTELDFYAGFSGEAGEVGYDIGYVYYAYPQDDDADYGEIYLSASVSAFSAGVNFVVNSDVSEPGLYVDGDIYYFISVGGEIAEDWSAALTVGYQDFDFDGSSALGDVSYAHYQFDITKSAGDYGDLTFTLSIAEEEAGDDDLIPMISWSKGF